MWCHLILGTPVIALLLFLVLPFWPALGLYAVLVAISGLVYWKVADEALRAPLQTGVEGLPGAEGVALSEVEGEGLVRLQGAVWQARAAEAIPQSERVRIAAVNGLVLQVEPSGGTLPAGQSLGPRKA